MKKYIRNFRILVFVFLITCSFISLQTVNATSSYGRIATENAEYTITINHDSLANQEIALLIYNANGNIDEIDTNDIGYIDQDGANDDGELIFDNIYISVPGTYDVYIGAQSLEQKELLGTITVTKKMLGDLNGDKKFTSIDALLVLKHMDTLSTEIADVNGDGEVNVKDALQILQVSTGEIGNFGSSQ